MGKLPASSKGVIPEGNMQRLVTELVANVLGNSFKTKIIEANNRIIMSVAKIFSALVLLGFNIFSASTRMSY